jgi:FixJ family two-component response regulator
MSRILIIDENAETRADCTRSLVRAGHDVVEADLGARGCAHLIRNPIDLVITELYLFDMSGLDIVKAARVQQDVPFVVMTGSATVSAVVAAMRLGVEEVLEKPVYEKTLVRTVENVLARQAVTDRDAPEAHAASRWAHALVTIIRASSDPRTTAAWSRHAAVSPGALRNWCCTAGIPSRRSLVFARLLRAVSLSARVRYSPADLLDVADRRTLLRMLRSAGFSNDAEIPRDVYEFVDRQTLIRNVVALRAVKRELRLRRDGLK